MFTKALVIATATAIKLQATLELSSLAGVNTRALSRDELAEIKAATKDAYNEYQQQYNKNYLTEDEQEARHEEWIHNKSVSEQHKKEDSSYQAEGTQFDDMTAEEREEFKGTRGMSALPDDERQPVPDHGEPDEEAMLAKTGDTWNAVYPGCTYTYQYIHDLAVQSNPTWGCNRFLNWDDHWLEQVGYRAYYDYYVVPGYCSDAYLRSWWNANIISWRNYLRDYLQCTDDSQQNDTTPDDNTTPDDGSNTNSNNCESVNADECLWGDEYVVPIKNQGSCGSCYAFSTTQILETYNAIAGNGLISLSEQQIVDCGYGNNYGCNGGWPASVLNSVASAINALWPEEDYEYTARVGICQNKNSTTRVKTNGSSQRVTSKSVSAMKQALMNGPLAITVDANDKFMSYSGGVLRSCVYGQLNHAVNAIGWTVMDGVEVVKVRNSWGTWWGDAGYVYVAIDSSAAAENGGLGPCGILEHLYWADATMA